MRGRLTRVVEAFRDVPWWLRALGALFLLLAAYLLAAPLRRPEPRTFRPTASPAVAAGDSLSPTRTITLDAREEGHWVGFDFSRGTVTAAGDSAGTDAGWDLAARRYHVIVNGGSGYAGRGAAVDLGPVSFDSVRVAPERGWVTTDGRGRDAMHPAFEEWYRYDFLSHLLLPRSRVYVVRTAEGHYAKVEFLSYYCPGPVAGCVTFRYRYQGDGTRRLAPPPR